MQDSYLGEIRPFAGGFEPMNWAFCHGQALSIAEHEALYSLIGTIYGGDGVTWFALPDLRGRVPIGTGWGPGLSNRHLGEMGGSEQVTLGVSHLPTHTHALLASDQGLGGNPTGNHPGMTSADAYGTGAPIGHAPTGSTGGNEPHENIAPSLVVNFLICIDGWFPQRD